MAYHHYYDRSYQLPGRRYESNTSRSRDYDAYQPRYEDHRNINYDSLPPADMKYSRRRLDDYSYSSPSSRHSNQPSLSRSVSYPVGHRRQATWPPFPTVEDLSEARAKEHNHSSLDENAGEEAINRGSIDQEPVLLEVKEEINPELRFVIVPGAAGDADGRSDGVPIRKDAACDDAHNSKRLPLQAERKKKPIEPPRRPPSPYAYSKPDLVRVRSDSVAFLSPDARQSASRKMNVPSQAPVDMRKLGRSGGAISEDSDLDEDEVPQLRSRRRPTRYSFSKDQLSSLPKESKALDKDRIQAPYSFNGDVKEDLPVLKERTSTPYSYKPAESNRQDLNTTSSRDVDFRERLSVRTTMPTSSRPDTPPRSTPFNSSSLGSAAGLTPQSSAMLTGDLPWSRPLPLRRSTCETLYGSTQRGTVSKPSSRPASPLAQGHDLPPSPPRSPMLRPKDDSMRPRSDPRSIPGPKQGSRNASRRGSPLSASFDLEPRTPRVESPIDYTSNRLERTTSFPFVNPPNDRSRPSSRHGRSDSGLRDEPTRYPRDAPVRADMQPPSARLPAVAAAAAGVSLPYPDNDAHQLMPSEEHFQFFPNSPQTPTRSSFPDNARVPATPITPIPSRLHEEFDYARKPAIRRTYSDTDATRRSTSTLAAREKKSSQEAAELELPSGPLPACPRSDYTTKYNDWYTLDGALSLDFCPECVENVVRRTPFRREFKRVLDMEPDYPKKCALGDPWFRIAWLLTLQEKRDDLALMRALAAVGGDEKECPDKHRAHRPWYSLPNRFNDGFIANLHVCQACMRRVEALMPALRGAFVRELSPATSAASTKYLCSLRTSSRRFPKYLDALLDVHAAALKRRDTVPDLTPFADLAQENAWKAECQRDTPLLGALWHVVPGVPDFTVCEECYDEVVWPLARSGSKIASLVTGALQYVDGSSSSSGGSGSNGGAQEHGVIGTAADEMSNGGADSDGNGNGNGNSTTADEGRSCQLYSARMRRAWVRACRDEDLAPFLRRVRERRQAERDIGARNRRLMKYLDDLEAAAGGKVPASGRDRELMERIKEEMERCRREWREWE
ncbi:hypothetical protein IWZ03DRAFT_413513 [Phyllosticta citriasiana]|uniref:Uncharacterized protein n=1 Tax=Phyllosticta citriasiana TaxID=595635 RepID=A0ABR1KQ46_9PEZI